MERELLAENLISFVPLLYKKLFARIPDFNTTRQQIGLLNAIYYENERSMSWYSEKMLLPKPSITVLSDKLIEDGYIERLYDPNDRRVIILKITLKGEEHLLHHKKILTNAIIEKTSSITEEEINRLNSIFEEIKTIFNKID